MAKIGAKLFQVSRPGVNQVGGSGSAGSTGSANSTGSTFRGSATGSFGSANSTGSADQLNAQQEKKDLVKLLYQKMKDTPEYKAYEEARDLVKLLKQDALNQKRYSAASEQAYDKLNEAENILMQAQSKLWDSAAYRAFKSAADDYKVKYGEAWDQ